MIERHSLRTYRPTTVRCLALACGEEKEGFGPRCPKRWWNIVSRGKVERRRVPVRTTATHDPRNIGLGGVAMSAMGMYRRSSRGAMVLGLLLAASACASGSITEGGGGRVTPLEVGDHEFDLVHDGRSRYYLAHVPPAASAGDELPLLLALHGGGGNPDQFKSDSGFDDVSDREGFIVLYPAGTGVLPRTLLTWNAGTDCCGFALDEGVDDVGFLLAVIDDLSSRTPVDSRRVYVSGHSNGGIMAYRMAAEASDRIAAIAPVAGAMQLEDFAPSRAVPVMHIHSVDDPRALYDGGLGPPFPLGGRQVLHQPVMDGLLSWVARNGCSAEPTFIDERVGQPGTLDEGHRAEELSWTPCASGAPVIHWRLHGSGHGWPGRTLTPAEEVLLGEPTQLVDAAEEVWAFVREHRLP